LRESGPGDKEGLVAWRRASASLPVAVAAYLLLSGIAFLLVLALVLPHFEALGSVYSLSLHDALDPGRDQSGSSAVAVAVGAAVAAGFSRFVWSARRRAK